MSNYIITRNTASYREAISAIDQLEAPLVRFAKPSDYQGSPSISAQIQLLVQIAESLREIQTELKAAGKRDAVTTPLLKDLIERLKTLCLGPSKAKEKQGKLRVFLDPYKTLKEEQAKLKKNDANLRVYIHRSEEAILVTDENQLDRSFIQEESFNQLQRSNMQYIHLGILQVARRSGYSSHYGSGPHPRKPDGLFIPFRKSSGAAGLDLAASEECTIPTPRGRKLIPTGLSMEIPWGTYDLELPAPSWDDEPAESKTPKIFKKLLPKEAAAVLVEESELPQTTLEQAYAGETSPGAVVLRSMETTPRYPDMEDDFLDHMQYMTSITTPWPTPTWDSYDYDSELWTNPFATEGDGKNTSHLLAAGCCRSSTRNFLKRWMPMLAACTTTPMSLTCVAKSRKHLRKLTQYPMKPVVQSAISREKRMGASLLRLFFHDCFGCDGSLLLDDTNSFTGEKTANSNRNSVRGFDVVDGIKSAVEKACPGVVSCADILAITARDAVVTLGGPNWEVKLGRRDSRTASLSAANNNIPPPTSNLGSLISKFSAQGLSAQEMVALVGAHTIGQARCTSFRDHIYNDTNIDASLAAERRSGCPRTRGSGDGSLAPLDLQTPTSFDNYYFKNLVAKKGLLHSDQQLFSGGSTDSLVKAYDTDPSKFTADFVAAMIKMGDISPLSGSQGEIRKNCRRVN
ncbi:hypothetical protein ZIOFF_058596 [Zingiber officinale]|uniref:peroxidase n=1 Tax=Zingiber officinale TaxID=94328 RepID=A0A8J5F8G3_ZINOF|nr:hypothetical protein ZIOFF_058596 [Zingiber officinale]